ncbi:hypothetical protein [Paraliomyxa miuraensis]|uniref:hypothetical protein n=1 Tax=Paraliomyxa miuraensis TaxID=376150 RepID=UPI002255E2B6|nr:hypothetical protein [Paraliomyxa miuraensis]MCX4239242.1 hypothetical protein [Paraliomyxa miuraensis]
MDRDRDSDRSVELRSSLRRDGRELRLALRELGRVTRAKLDVHLLDRHVALLLLSGFAVGSWWGVRSGRHRTLVLITAAPSACLRIPG